MAKIIRLEEEVITFDDGSVLYSSHEQDCCEHHYLDPTGLELAEVKDLEFDLDQPLEELIEEVEGYGIRLKSINNFPLSIPAYGYNNGYYGNNINLTLKTSTKEESVDITHCQKEIDC